MIILKYLSKNYTSKLQSYIILNNLKYINEKLDASAKVAIIVYWIN